MIFVLISRRQQPQNYRLSSATILPLPLQTTLLRSLDFTISQDRRRTANLLLSLHALISLWSKKMEFGRALFVIMRCGRNRPYKTRRYRAAVTSVCSEDDIILTAPDTAPEPDRRYFLRYRDVVRVRCCCRRSRSGQRGR